MSQLSPLNPTSLKALGPSEELVATVPDLQFGVVADGVTELNYTFTNSRKRNRNDSGCSLSDFEISGDEDFSFIDLKRPCSAISSSPYALPISYPAKEFNIELDSAFQFGPGTVSTDQQPPVTNILIGNQCQKLSGYPQQLKTGCLDRVFTGMQPAELPTNPYKHDLMLNCDQDCKLVITEHPEEVLKLNVLRLLARQACMVVPCPAAWVIS